MHDIEKCYVLIGREASIFYSMNMWCKKCYVPIGKQVSIL